MIKNPTDKQPLSVVDVIWMIRQTVDAEGELICKLRVAPFSHQLTPKTQNMSTRIINTDHVLPPLRPCSPSDDDIVPLSFFDTYWIALPPTQRLFLFPNAAGLPFPALLRTLKSALSDTLHLYRPLAGKLTYLPHTGDVVVDCSTAAIGDGVAFSVAESDGDVRQLAAEATHDVESFGQLVPVIDAGQLPAPVLAVQVTQFTGGGVALGYAFHHTVMDGHGVWLFLEAWARACRGDAQPAGVPTATHDRAAIGHPRSGEIARRYLRTIAPELPEIKASSVAIQHRLELTRRTFMIQAKAIQSLKQPLLSSIVQGQDPFVPPPSTFVALSAHAWISIAHAETIDDDKATVLCFTADCRRRLDPPLDEGYTGNCVTTCYATVTGSELRGAGGFRRACMAIQQAIRVFTEDPMGECENWMDVYLSHTLSARVVYVVGSPWFRAYEMDFGWGSPNRAELVSMNHDGEVVLLGGREKGEVQVSVSLSALYMDSFASVFETGFRSDDVSGEVA